MELAQRACRLPRRQMRNAGQILSFDRNDTLFPDGPQVAKEGMILDTAFRSSADHRDSRIYSGSAAMTCSGEISAEPSSFLSAATLMPPASRMMSSMVVRCPREPADQKEHAGGAEHRGAARQVACRRLRIRVTISLWPDRLANPFAQVEDASLDFIDAVAMLRSGRPESPDAPSLSGNRPSCTGRHKRDRGSAQ